MKAFKRGSHIQAGSYNNSSNRIANCTTIKLVKFWRIMSILSRRYLVALLLLSIVLLAETRRRNRIRGSEKSRQNPKRPCFRERRRIQRKIERRKIVDLLPPSCDTDGYYEPRQCNFHGCYCVDKFGRTLKRVHRGWATNSEIACSGLA